MRDITTCARDSIPSRMYSLPSMMEAFCTHPNVGAVPVVSLGCEQFNRPRLVELVRASGRPCELVVIQKRAPRA